MGNQRKIQSRMNRPPVSSVRSKSYGVILCLFVLFFYLIRPVLPFIEYSINKEYISQNLCIKKNIPGNCCQGKCYLLEQIKKNSEPLNSNTDTNKKNGPDQKVEDHLPSEGISTIPIEKVSLLKFNYCLRIIEQFYSQLFVPPEF